MQTTPQTQPAPAAQPKPRKAAPPPEYRADQIAGLEPDALVRLLEDPGATEFQKAKACQRLASTGGAEAVPPLAALLTHPTLSHYARYGLEPNPAPAAPDALRAALSSVKGKLLVGVINSIGARRDPEAAGALAKLLRDPDLEVAQAAAAALGRIGGPVAAKALQDALGTAKEPVRTAAAAAGLVCAEGLLAAGERDRALAFYDLLMQPGVARPVRLAAMHATIAAETSIGRPR